MQFRLYKLRFRRQFRKSQQQVEDFGQHAEANLEQHFFRRLSSLGGAWRFITTWLLLFVILIGCLAVQLEELGNHFQSVKPVPGGTYTEGVLGTFSNANPLYATSNVNSTVSHLVFAGLFQFDSQNHLVGDLAKSYDVDAKGTTYTVHLKANLTWQDGKPLTADDVVFTYQAIQNPDARSPLIDSWQGITVAKKDAYTVTFTLPNPLSSFPYTLVNGIVPHTAFDNLPPTDWRSADFNTVHPIGAGPFSWSELQVENSESDKAHVLIALQPFAGYQGGKPKLDSFVVDSYTDQNQLLDAYRSNKLNAIAGLPTLPTDLANDKDSQQYNLILNAASMAFLNTASGVTADPQVRQALLLATNRNAIIASLGYATPAVNEPLLVGQLGYNRAYAQAAFDPAQAKAALDKDGWLVGNLGVRYKDGKPLNINLVAGSDSEYSKVAEQLQTQWEAVGVQVTLELDNTQDFQAALSANSYDAVLYGITIGVDPDVFVYWDSSQTDPRSSRLNLSLYKSATADAALEAGRTRLDPMLRVIKYKPFLQVWQQDTPAIGLYQPRFLYITHEKVYGLDGQFINTSTDRFANVQNWMIRTAKVTND
jgi:peptide/nickel transport system substrate-binding protein